MCRMELKWADYCCAENYMINIIIIYAHICIHK